MSGSSTAKRRPKTIRSPLRAPTGSCASTASIARLAMPNEHLHFPAADPTKYEASWQGVRCAVMQGGQGEMKHWAFNDPVRRDGRI